MPRFPAAVLASLALLVLPASAGAFEGFVGVTENGSLVRFTSQTPYALNAPKAPSGLAAGERIVALGNGARGLVAVGSSARLYALDVASGRATAIGPSFTQGLRGSRFSLAVAPAGERARLLSDVGQDLQIDLATGAAEPGPGLRRERDGAPVRPAADAAPDGHLVGVQLNPAVLLRELARGTTTMAESPLETLPGIGLGEPIGFQLGADGRGYVLVVDTDRQRDRQSALLIVDPSTGRLAGSRSSSFQVFGRRLVTMASLGPAPRDRTPARATVTLPKRISARALLAHRLPLKVRSSEAGQITVSVRVTGKAVGFAFATRDTPGVFALDEFAVAGRDIGRVRGAVGKRARVVIGVNDLKGNRRTIVRTVRIVR